MYDDDYPKLVNVNDLIGKTIKSISNNDDRINIDTEEGYHYEMYHNQDCCESVTIEDINGDLEDLIGTPILIAEESVSNDYTEAQLAEINKRKINEGDNYYQSDDSFTWSFYKFATIKGYVTIRWYGSSNGYYSEGVSFYKSNN